MSRTRFYQTTKTYHGNGVTSGKVRSRGYWGPYHNPGEAKYAWYFILGIFVIGWPALIPEPAGGILFVIWVIFLIFVAAAVKDAKKRKLIPPMPPAAAAPTPGPAPAAPAAPAPRPSPSGRYVEGSWVTNAPEQYLRALLKSTDATLASIAAEELEKRGFSL